MRDYKTYSETMDFEILDSETEEVLDTIEQRIPKTMLPVANNLGGDLFLMNIDKEDFGSIWYWQRRDITFGKEGNTLFGEVAPDYKAFLGCIKPQSEIESGISDSE